MADIYMNQPQYNHVIFKVQRYPDLYRPFLYRTLCSLPCSFYQTEGHLTSPEQVPEWTPIAIGDHWGGEDFQYAWFRASFTVPPELAGKKLTLFNRTQSAEALLFVSGEPVGMFDVCDDMMGGDCKHHRFFPLTPAAREGETFDIALEGYGGHFCTGCGPYDTFDGGLYPLNRNREFRGLEIVEIDELVQSFLWDLQVVLQLYDRLPEDQYTRWDAAAALEQVYRLLPQKPEYYEWADMRQRMAQAREALAAVLAKPSTLTAPVISLCGHSHLDTAWLWPVEETKRKAARTIANALQLMDRYPDYTFIQSSVLYLQWMKDYYPSLFDRIKVRTAEGRWEPNGGSWVEPDCYMPSGELLIRHFLRGQTFLRDELGYHADSFWLPDTFGYNAAIPQILRGFDMKYFLTTKLSWNDTTQFPYDSFIWEGQDGSEVLVHCNITHRWPDVDTVRHAADEIRQRRASRRKLLSYGFGDGGGGPHDGMLEIAARIENLQGLPPCEKTTVSRFMQTLEAEGTTMPRYTGELYMEGHRGTLTQFHDIKRTNRKAEIALRDLEFLGSFAGIFGNTAYPEGIQALYDVLMLNQFHDILPGTSIPRVMETAIRENRQMIEQARAKTADCLRGLCRPGEGLTLVNTLSFDRQRQFSLPDAGMYPAGVPVQRYTDVEGNARMAVQACLPAMSTTVLPAGEAQEAGTSPFRYDGSYLETPFLQIAFDEDGYIASLIDKRTGHELRRPGGRPLGAFLAGDDVPTSWDNWDINLDQQFKMSVQKTLQSREVVSDGALQFRLRSRYLIGRKSELVQDLVVYADSARIDFETVADWRETHTLLKAEFDLNLHAAHAKTESQFGYLERPCRKNSVAEQAKFEVCNHKWTDLSENRYGAVVLNDCKYGISIEGSCLQLTLHKSGAHPTPEGDCGVHAFTYALLPHEGGFSAPTVVQPAWELNCAPLVCAGVGPQQQFLSVEPSNILVESVKRAEDGNGWILRLYECEQSGCSAAVTLGFDAERVVRTNMMEDPLEELPLDGRRFTLPFRAFEIQTVRVLATRK